MSHSTTDTPDTANPHAADAAASASKARMPNVKPVLDKLFELYPSLFGAQFKPLKVGVFQELLTAHPEHFEKGSLKAALGVHTRSSAYLQCVASGMPRHDLRGEPVEALAPEHILFALVELFRRKQPRSKEDLRSKWHARVLAAFDASGLSRDDYMQRVHTRDALTLGLLQEAFALRDAQLAKQEALRLAFERSGKSLEEFADMYGMTAREVSQAVGAPARGVTSAAPQATTPP